MASVLDVWSMHVIYITPNRRNKLKDITYMSRFNLEYIYFCQ